MSSRSSSKSKKSKGGTEDQPEAAAEVVPPELEKDLPPPPAGTSAAAAAGEDDDDDGNRSDISEFDPCNRTLLAVVPEGVDAEFCKTYVMKKQGHTLGNALKFVISQYPDVQFCGYTQPHPAEDLIHFRLQTIGVPCDSVLHRGLHELKKMCLMIKSQFIAQRKEFDAKQQPAKPKQEPQSDDDSDSSSSDSDSDESDSD